MITITIHDKELKSLKSLLWENFDINGDFSLNDLLIKLAILTKDKELREKFLRKGKELIQERINSSEEIRQRCTTPNSSLKSLPFLTLQTTS